MYKPWTHCGKCRWKRRTASTKKSMTSWREVGRRVELRGLRTARSGQRTGEAEKKAEKRQRQKMEADWADWQNQQARMEGERLRSLEARQFKDSKDWIMFNHVEPPRTRTRKVCVEAGLTVGDRQPVKKARWVINVPDLFEEKIGFHFTIEGANDSETSNTTVARTTAVPRGAREVKSASAAGTVSKPAEHGKHAEVPSEALHDGKVPSMEVETVESSAPGSGGNTLSSTQPASMLEGHRPVASVVSEGHGEGLEAGGSGGHAHGVEKGSVDAVVDGIEGASAEGLLTIARGVETADGGDGNV